MKHPQFSSFVWVALSLMCAAPALAQSQVAKDEPVELSPFVVSSTADKGYQATETLAGTRLRTDLKDIAASIDVLTEAFLDDVAAIDVTDALQYVANVSVFEGDTSDPTNNSQWFDYSYVSRGIRGNTVLTDFFPTGSVPIDRYNTEGLTVARGPNAILFGIGSPSGVVGANSKRALLHKDLYSLRFMADSDDSARTEVDVSKVIVRDKLAVRLAAVASDKHTFHEPSLIRRNAIFGTATYAPFKRTRITVNAEKGIHDRIHEPSLVIRDQYTPWVQAGKPTVNWKTGAGQNSPGMGNYSTAAGSGLSSLASGVTYLYIEGSELPIMNWQRMAQSQGFGFQSPEFARYNIQGTDRNNLFQRGFNEDTNTLTLPDGTSWELDLDANVFGVLNRNNLDYEKKSIFLEQNLWDDLDIELAWNRFDMDFIFDFFGTPHAIFADPNELLPNGDPNPYVGRPYVQSTLNTITREKRIFETYRATVAYKLDLDDHKIFRNIGLGNYRFFGLFEDQDNDVWLADSRLVNTAGTNKNLNAAANIIHQRYYLEPGESSYRLVGPRRYNQPEVGVVAEQMNAGARPRRTFRGTQSLVGAIQAQWWRAKEGYYRITGLYGERRDKQKNRDMTFLRDPVTGLYAADFNNFASIDPTGTWNPATETKADTKTYSVIVRPFSFLGVFYNYSDVFRAGDPAFEDVFGNPLRPSYGDTQDYGVKLNLWKDRLHATVTQYETTVFDQTFDQFAGITDQINDIYDAIGRPDFRFERKFFGYRDDTSKGTEVALVANITNNWRTRVSFGSQDTKISKLYDEVQAYVDSNAAAWSGPNGANAALPLPNPTNSGNATSATYNTVAHAVNAVVNGVRDRRVTLGSKPNNLREYNASLFTNYTFSSGVLKNLRLGGGFRWASENIIGYGRTDGRLNVALPFEGPEQFNTDASIGYSRRLGKDGRYTWDIQLNVANVFNDDDEKAMSAVPSDMNEPVVDRWVRVAPRSWRVTTSLRF